MPRPPKDPDQKGKHLDIYPKTIIVKTLGVGNCKTIAVTAIERAYSQLQKETARLSKEAQQNAMEKSAERVNDNV